MGFILFLKHIMTRIFLFSVLLCFVSCNPVPNKEEEETRNLLMDIFIGQIQDQIENQINNLLGITTTKATPVLDLVGGLLGGETTTTPAPVTENANLIQALLGILFPTTTTTTTTTPTTEPPTTTKCGGLLGGGLLC